MDSLPVRQRYSSSAACSVLCAGHVHFFQCAYRIKVDGERSLGIRTNALLMSYLAEPFGVTTVQLR
jgi:hypothetical protein